MKKLKGIALGFALMVGGFIVGCSATTVDATPVSTEVGSSNSIFVNKAENKIQRAGDNLFQNLEIRVIEDNEKDMEYLMVEYSGYNTVMIPRIDKEDIKEIIVDVVKELQSEGLNNAE